MGERVGSLRPLRAPQALAAGHGRLFLDMLSRQFGDEAAEGMRAGPLAVDAAVGGVHDGRVAPGAGDGDIGEAALLLEAGEAAFVERALRREDAFFPAGQPDMSNSSPLAAWMVMIVTLSPCLRSSLSMTRLTCSRKAREGLIFLHRPGQLGEVFEAAGGFGAALGLEHGGVAALIEHDPGELGMRQLARHLTPAGEVGDETAEAAPRLRASARRCRASARRRAATVLRARARGVDGGDRLVAEAALGWLTMRSNARSSAGDWMRRR